jgi:hypothetical protein
MLLRVQALTMRHDTMCAGLRKLSLLRLHNTVQDMQGGGALMGLGVTQEALWPLYLC